MGRIMREAVVSIYDILRGCQTLIRREVPVGESLDNYSKYIEFVLDRYFFDLDQGDLLLNHVIEEDWELDAALALEICRFVEKQLLQRIQRTFTVVYPNRHYQYTLNEEQGLIRIVESTWSNHRLETNLQEIDDSDAWIPERLRVR